MEVYISSDNLITLTGLYDVVADAYANAATMKAEIFTYVDQSTQIGDDVTMNYITDSDGDYRGQLLKSVELVYGTLYVIQITVTDGDTQLIVKVQANGVYVNES